MIRKSFSPVVVKSHPRSNDVEVDFRLRRDINGNVSYVQIGEHSVSEYVGSFAKGCSLKSILERCSLMPLHYKVAMLNQSEQGIEVDFRTIPKDLTEAFIKSNRLSLENPELSVRLRSGESSSNIIKDIINNDVKKGDINNGETESSNE